MGRLKPGASYIYEHADGITYARELGAPPKDRFIIGEDADSKRRKERRMWEDIYDYRERSPALQDAMEKCIIIYKLIKDHDDV